MVMLFIKLKRITKCSSMVAYILTADPPQPMEMGSIGQNSTIQNMVMLHIKLKEITKCSSMVVTILPSDPSLTLLFGSKGQNSTCSEHGHVAYQIKGNHQMQQHGSKDFPRRPLTDPWDGVIRSKLSFFRTWQCCLSN